MKNPDARYEALGLDQLDMIVGGGGDRVLTPPPNPLGITNASVLAGRNAFAADAAEHGGSVGGYVGYGTNVLGSGPSTVMTFGSDGLHFYNVGSNGIGNGASSSGLVGVWAANEPSGSAYWGGPGNGVSVGLKSGGSASLDLGWNAGGGNAGISFGPGAAVGGVAVSASTTFGTEIHPFGIGAPTAQADHSSPPGDQSFDARWNSDMNALGSNHPADNQTFDARWNSDMNALAGNHTADNQSFDARWNSDMNALAGDGHTLPASVQNEFGLSPSGEPLGVDHSNGANPFDAGAGHTGLPASVQSEFGLSPSGEPLGVDHSNGANPFDAGASHGSDGGAHTDAGPGPVTVAANDTGVHADIPVGHTDDSASHVDTAPASVSPPPVSAPPPVLDTPPPMIDIPPPVIDIPVFAPPPVTVAAADPIPIPVSVPTNPVVDTSPSGDSGGGGEVGSFDVAGDFDTGGFDAGGGGGSDFG